MSDSTLYCSFCGKSQHEVKCIVAGPTVYICDECVAICVAVLPDPGNREQTAFSVGDNVEKYTGDYQLTGEVRSVFKTKSGKTRVVVEHSPGFLRIYSEANLRPVSLGGDA